jgi:hypothetical protein
VENTISREEHEEFARRIDAENERQNHRISLLEESARQINQLTIAVEKMAINMENMLKVMDAQSERITDIEKEPIETHKKVWQAVITTSVGTIVGAIVGAIIAIII